LVKWTKAFVSNGWLLKLECVQYLEFRPHPLQRDPVAGIGRSSAFSSLMTSQLGIWSYGAQVSQPIFTGGALKGNLHLAESQYRQLLLAYQQAIQRAFGDVSDALIGYQKLHEVRVRQEVTVADLQESVSLSDMHHKGGTIYLEVLDGQRSLYSAELTLAQARGNEYQSLVRLYRSLGGGWQQ
jgi:multidrug efflux system outer membrane protein